MVLGIDMGGTNTEFAVVDSTKGIMHLEQIKTKSHDSFLNYIENFTDMVKSYHQYDFFYWNRRP